MCARPPTIASAILSFAAAFLLAIPPAHAVDLLAYDTFTCGNSLCEADDSSTSGDAIVDESTFELRSQTDGLGGTIFNLNEDRARAWITFRACDAGTVTIDASVWHFGQIRGFGGLNSERGEVRIRLVLRDFTDDDDIVGTDLVNESENGSFGMGIVNDVGGAFESPVAGTIVGAVTEGHTYGAMIELRTRAAGSGGWADFRAANQLARLETMSISLDPSEADTDGDGLLDSWETVGVDDCDGNIIVDLPSMGAAPDVKDLFVELDWLQGKPPTRNAVQTVKQSFAVAPPNASGTTAPGAFSGIKLWVDTGALSDPSAAEDGGAPGTCGDGIDNGGGDGADGADVDDCRVGDNLGGGNMITIASLPDGTSIPKLSGDADGNGAADFFEVKGTNFDLARRAAFRYGIVGIGKSNEDGAGAGSCGDGIDNGGDGLTDTGDTLDCFGGGQADGGANFIEYNGDPGTLMHEIGHTLGLRHGGSSDGTNCKPNYLSVMSYSTQRGIPQDLDGDGMAEAAIVDYSPLLGASGRVAAPLPTVPEGSINESMFVLDNADTTSFFIFNNDQNVTTQRAVNVPVDWSGDNDDVGGLSPNDTNAGDDVNRIGSIPGCLPNPPKTGESLTGADDWTNIRMQVIPSPIGPMAVEAVDPVEEPEPTLEDFEKLDEMLNQTDLEAVKTVAPEPIIPGQPVTYTIGVTNHGPNATMNAEIVDTPPPGTTFLNLPAACAAVGQTGKVRCETGPVAAGDTTTFDLTARLPVNQRCERGQFTEVVNRVDATNLAGPEINTRNNRFNARNPVLCLRYEYAAKFVCGTQREPSDLHLTPGLYATTVNIHNPSDEQVYFFKKVALSVPPKKQAEGKIIPLGLDQLSYDGALEVDCTELRDRAFRGEFPADYTEGFVVVQSPRSLDVTAVYTAASTAPGTRSGQSTSIDVERVPERKRKQPDPQPDLVIKDLTYDTVCSSPSASTCKIDLRYVVANIGDADAAQFTVAVGTTPGGTEISTDTVVGGLAAGTELIRSIGAPISQADAAAGRVCAGADLPVAAVEELREDNNIYCNE